MSNVLEGNGDQVKDVPPIKNDLKKLDIEAPFEGLQKSFSALASNQESHSETEENSDDLKITPELEDMLKNRNLGELDKFFPEFGKMVISQNPMIKELFKRLIMDKLQDILLANTAPDKKKSAAEQVNDIANHPNTPLNWKEEAKKLYDKYNDPNSFYKVNL